MTKYRILTNGDRFRIQRKFKWWPFWTSPTIITSEAGSSWYIEFGSEEEARQYIRTREQEAELAARPWTVLD